MGQFIDATGLRFGRWTVSFKRRRVLQPNGRSRIQWLCVCDCGTAKYQSLSNLKNGISGSCGCFRAEHPNHKTHGLTGTPEYVAWQRMLSRCYNKKDIRFGLYGDRGIFVCAKWRHSFSAFLTDIGSKPSPQYSIERVNRNGHYTPLNVKWATPIEQARNTSRNRLLTLNGETLPISAWAERAGLNSTTIRQRIDAYGWDVKRALTSPVITRRR